MALTTLAFSVPRRVGARWRQLALAAALLAASLGALVGGSAASGAGASAPAQLFQADPAATPAEVEAALSSTAHKLTDGAAYTGSDAAGTTSYDKGHGLVDVVVAVAALAA